jgi:7-cyano-7-deazaguanine synthase
MSKAVQAGTYTRVEILSPFSAMTKTHIAMTGKKLGLEKIMSGTWSCYKGGAKHCGTCGTCVERKEAFSLAGVKDETVYEETECTK